jgi:hypothetical protein
MSSVVDVQQENCAKLAKRVAVDGLWLVVCHVTSVSC